MFLNTTLLGSASTTEFRFTNGVESQAALDLLEDRLLGPRPMAEMVIVQSETLTVDDPAFQAKAESVFDEILALGPGVIKVGQNYYQAGDVMIHPVSTVEEGTPIAEVVESMLSNHFNRVPVMQAETVVGIITRHDLLKLISMDT